jgi:hypothetical protein
MSTGTWRDVSNERYCVYIWPDKTEILIGQPLALLPTDEGHEIRDAYERVHLIPNGWVHRKAKLKAGL